MRPVGLVGAQGRRSGRLAGQVVGRRQGGECRSVGTGATAPPCRTAAGSGVGSAMAGGKFGGGHRDSKPNNSARRDNRYWTKRKRSRGTTLRCARKIGPDVVCDGRGRHGEARFGDGECSYD